MQMTVTWTSGYDINEATPFVEWGRERKTPVQAPAGTLTFDRNSMCGMVYLIYLAGITLNFYCIHSLIQLVFSENLK